MAPDKLDATNATAKSTIPGKTAARVVREKLLAIHGVRARIVLLEDIKVLAATMDLHAPPAPVVSTVKIQVPLVVILVQVESSPQLQVPRVANFATTVNTSSQTKVVVPTVDLENTTRILVVPRPALSVPTVRVGST